MRLELSLPTETVFDGEARKITAEAREGSFTILPKHIDFLAALVPGILIVESQQGQQLFFAVNDGVLVKQGDLVLVSCIDAVSGGDIGTVGETVRESFEQRSERERKSRTVLARLETDLARRFYELGKAND